MTFATGYLNLCASQARINLQNLIPLCETMAPDRGYGA
jgi:hypothetical protein